MSHLTGTFWPHRPVPCSQPFYTQGLKTHALFSLLCLTPYPYSAPQIFWPGCFQVRSGFCMCMHCRCWLSPWSRASSGPKNLLGCTLQACNACTCPALQPKKESGVSNRDIGGLMDGGAYLSEARSWRTPQSLQQTAGRTRWQEVFTPEVGKERLAVRGQLTSGGLTSYQGNQ